MAGKKKLGEMLIEKGLISEAHLERALLEQKQWGGRLGANLIKLGLLGEVTLLKFLGSQMGLPCADLSKMSFSDNINTFIPEDVVRQHHVMPLDARVDGGKKVLFLAMSEPTDLDTIDEIMFRTGYTVKPVLATASQIESAIDMYYRGIKRATIEPLKAKTPVVKKKDMDVLYGEERFLQADKVEVELEELSPALKALLEILIKKGLLTREEYLKELSGLKEPGT